jgi:hypothetical protein
MGTLKADTERRMASATHPSMRKTAAFDESETQALAAAYDDICKSMNVPTDAEGDRETIAIRVIDLARAGALDPHVLRERVLREARALARL